MAIINITDSRPLGPRIFVTDESDDIDTAAEVIALGVQPGDIVIDIDNSASYVMLSDRTLQQIGSWPLVE